MRDLLHEACGLLNWLIRFTFKYLRCADHAHKLLVFDDLAPTGGLRSLRSKVDVFPDQLDYLVAHGGFVLVSDVSPLYYLNLFCLVK